MWAHQVQKQAKGQDPIRWGFQLLVTSWDLKSHLANQLPKPFTFRRKWTKSGSLTLMSVLHIIGCILRGQARMERYKYRYMCWQDLVDLLMTHWCSRENSYGARKGPQVAKFSMQCFLIQKENKSGTIFPRFIENCFLCDWIGISFIGLRNSNITQMELVL